MLLPVSLPPPVRPGDRVGVAALSGPVDAERLERGVEALAALGFEPCLGDNLGRRTGYLAGSDAERLAGFHRLAADPSLAAIFFARGGYGAMRLLAGIDWDLLAARPRAYVGYSDLTPFLLEVVRRLRLVTFHGPMVAADLARGLLPEERESLLHCLAGELPLTYPLGEWIRQGDAEGPLLGGCLSLLAATAGTAYFPDLEGALLFVEEVGEPLYRLDRLLTQLRLAGALDEVGALVFGHLGLPRPEEAPALAGALAGVVDGFDWPVVLGLPGGHSAPNLTLPLGLRSRLDGAAGALRVGINLRGE
jgi:muramoyltetrapeptide carboxypeptidase